MEITHITVTTGRISIIAPGDVSPEAARIVRKWLPSVLNENSKALPVKKLSHFDATVFQVGLGAVATIYAPAAPHRQGKPPKGNKMPLVTFGVATDTETANIIWDSFKKANPRTRLVKQPPVPWCATIIYPTLSLYIEAAKWLGDFERCVAWVVVEDTTAVPGQPVTRIW